MWRPTSRPRTVSGNVDTSFYHADISVIYSISFAFEIESKRV